MTVRETLKEARRYEQILDILTKIAESKEESFPVDCYADDEGKAQFRVEGECVRSEAIILKKAIIYDKIDTIDFDDVNNLYYYVESSSDMLVHNCGITVSHKVLPEQNLDLMRQWLILHHLILYLIDDSTFQYDIPDGWKNKEVK